MNAYKLASFRQLQAITIYIFRLQYIRRYPLVFYFPLLIPLCFPFLSPLLTWNPPCCDRIRPPWSQVARKLIYPFPSLPIPSPFRNPDPLGFFGATCALTKTTSQHWLTSPEQELYCISSEAGFPLPRDLWLHVALPFWFLVLFQL